MTNRALSQNHLPKSKIHPNWVFFSKVFLVSWFLFAVNDVLSFFLYSHNFTRILNGLCIASVISIFGIVFRKFIKSYLFIVYLVILLPSAIFFMHLLIFQTAITGNEYYVLFESPPNEALEFFKQNIKTHHLALLCIYVLLPLPFLFSIKSNKIFPDNRFIFLMVVIAILSIGLYRCKLNIQTFRTDNYMFDLVFSHSEFLQEKKILKTEIEKRKLNTKKEITKKCIPEGMNPVLVFVIGESISKNHMSLYAYDRNTNKLLNEIKSELFIFDSVFSSSAHTIPSLKNALSFSTRENQNLFYTKHSVVELLNKAGYETWWISNQKPLGVYETQTSVIAHSARYTHFVNNTVSAWKNEHDEALLIPFENALKSKATKKAVFIHLMGAHEDFQYRYPQKYDFFKNSKGIQSAYAKNDTYKTGIINTYDNAVLYNDFILRRIIDLTNKNSTESAVLFFSDHGEEVYDEKDFFGHAGWKPTKNMYEIPFILWASDSMKSKNDSLFSALDTLVHRQYCTEDLIHSMLDLSMLKCSDYDSTKSIFSPYYKLRPNYILQIK